jgi:hypothetical protein
MACEATRMHYFHELNHEQQCSAVRRMASGGMSERAIAHACEWSVEYVRHVLSEYGSTTGAGGGVHAPTFAS